MANPSAHSQPPDWQQLIRSTLYSADIYTLAILAAYSILAIVFYNHIPMAATLLLENLLIVVVIASSVLLSHLTEFRLFTLIRYFYVIPVVYLMYDQTHYFVRLVHPYDYDNWLVEADRWIFGCDPTVWLGKLAFPALTEYLQICYFLFYVLPVTHAIELWYNNDIERLKMFARKMSFVFYLSYIAYFALPAVGPRFTVHDFASTALDLPSLCLTEPLRAIVNAGGGITAGALHPIDVVNRDCMPSGHTMLTLVNIFLAFRFRSRFRYVFAVIGGSLIVSTVYLRYHYVVDVLAGIILVFLLLPAEIPVDKYCRNYIQKIAFRRRAL
ncbi:MAG: phosphatase PAP2 family protein [Ignavibacteria bacterium]|nr:phosphatase PAP2 family protein [Ignavibacteria bacterium]